jgi:geranylgeranyl reductase family protein
MRGSPDAIVVGAGPSGSTAARCLAELGARVVLFDRAHFPRDKLCGGGLTPKAIGLVPPLAVARVQRWVERVEIRSRTGTFEIAESLARVGMVDRRAFDLSLVEAAAAAGVEVREATMVVGAAASDTGVEVVVAGGALERAAALVVADGEPSRLARVLGLASPPVRHILAIEINAPLAPGIGGERAVLGCRVPGGYAWYFPKGDHASIGVGTARADRHSFLRQDLDAFTATLGLTVPRGTVRGHWIPLGLRRGPLAAARVVLAGDAAGAADPLFAEGIAFALATGVLAARSIGQLLDGQAVDLLGYERAVRRTLGPRMRELGGAVRIADLSVSLPLAALRTSARFRRFSARYVNEFAGPI